jgi:tetratricopeptide (TPR) repeat protein
MNPSHISRRHTNGLLFLLGASLLLPGQFAPAATEAGFLAAARDFDAAQAGDTGALLRAADAFGALQRSEPGNPVLLAYTGAATAMKAATTMLPWKKLGFAEEGLAQLDKALELLTPAHDAPLYRNTPAVLETRLTAANTFLAVPGFMNRGERGAKLLQQVLDSPLLAQSPLPFRGVVWMRAGRQAQKDQRSADARRWYEQVVAQNAPQAATAQAALKDLPQ